MILLPHVLALLLLAAPVPGDPAPRHALPDGMESAPWDAFWVDQCKERLEAAGMTEGYYFSPHNRLQSRRITRTETIYCHVPQAVVWSRGPTGARYGGFTMVNCAMALAMARFEVIAQEEARKVFGDALEAPITYITHVGTYNCRTLRLKSEKQSQHSFGNGIDITGFYVRGYGAIEIQRHWTARWPALQKGSLFLHNLVARLRAEQVFTNILDPTWDGYHANHLHIDLAPTSDGLPSVALEKAKASPVSASAPPREGAGRAAAAPVEIPFVGPEAWLVREAHGGNPAT
ncbi:MAG: extensin family protein, partial [Myxococcales bacterium]|nr:extensin family protein [Myxococcales bacterium]